MFKHIFIVAIALVLLQAANTQPAKKTDKIPTSAELQKMMKEAQQALDKMSPEDKKMMEEMGIKMPDLNKAVPKGITDKQIQQAYEDDKLWVPRKNMDLITRAGKKLATEAELKSFLITSCANIKKGLGTMNMANAAQVIKEIKAKANGGQTTDGQVATILMLASRSKLALAAFTTAFEQPDAINYNDLSNFTALSNMMGGVQVSLPILNFMDTKFPNSDIILNNIGQAWFSCGEKDQAKAFFLKCIALSPNHPQANEGLACVYMAEGKVADAQACMRKSIKKTYSVEKEDRAKKMGYKMTLNDYSMPPRLPQDPLGFTGIEKPVYQMELDGYAAAWQIYSNWLAGINDTYNDLKQKHDLLGRKLEETMTAENVKKSVGDFMKNGDFNAMMVNMNMNPMAIKVGNYFSKLNSNSPTYTESFGKAIMESAQQYIDNLANINNAVKAMWKEANEWIEKNCVGCAQKVSEKQCCDKQRAPAAYELSAHNALARAKLEKDIDAYEKFHRDDLYYKQYMLGEIPFEMAKLEAEMSFINLLKDNKGMFTPPPCVASKDNKPGKNALSKFEDTHCPYKTFTISEPSGTLKATFSCGGTTKELDLPFLKMTQVNDMDDRYVKGTAWIGIAAGVDRELGPLKAAAEASAGFFVEMSAAQGITDYGATAGIEGKLGANADLGPVPSDIKAGVNGKISFTSGTATASGSGLFDGISISNK